MGTQEVAGTGTTLKDKTEQDVRGRWKILMMLKQQHDSLWIQSLFRRGESRVSDRHSVLDLSFQSSSLPLHFLPLSFPAAAAPYPSRFVQVVAPLDDGCISTSPTGAVAKAAVSLSGNHLF